MDSQIKILHIVSDLGSGGVEKLLETYYANMDKNKIKFAFITHREIGTIGKRFQEWGCSIYQISFRRKHPFKSAIEAYHIIKHEKYKIIHLHGNLEICLQLISAWLAGAKVRISHSHSFRQNPSLLKKIERFITRIITKLFATDYFACSIPAGVWQYGHSILNDPKFHLIKNAIEVEKFIYNPAERIKIRQQLSIEDNFVIGHVGRFDESKNHEFIIDIFYSIYQRRKTSRLLLIGEGENQKNIKEKVKILGLDKVTLFLNIRQDIPQLLQAMDVFLLPSRYEGLPVVGIEAQAAGLPCIVSSNVTREVKITENLLHMSLKDPADCWADKVMEYVKFSRKSTLLEVKSAGYDVKEQAQCMQKLYFQIALLLSN